MILKPINLDNTNGTTSDDCLIIAINNLLKRPEKLKELKEITFETEGFTHELDEFECFIDSHHYELTELVKNMAPDAIIFFVHKGRNRIFKALLNQDKLAISQKV